MKLYGTISSERATKGQGGKYLHIQLQGEEKQSLGVMSVRQIEDYYIGVYHYNNTGVQVFKIKTKGKN